MADSAAKVGDEVSDLASQTWKTAQNQIEKGKPALRDLQASAGEAVSEATELPGKASAIGVQAVKQGSDAIQGAARDAYSRALTFRRKLALSVYTQEGNSETDSLPEQTGF